MRPGKYLRQRMIVTAMALNIGLVVAFCFFFPGNWTLVNTATKICHYLDPEYAHKISKTALKYKLIPCIQIFPNSHQMEVDLWGLDFPSPIGMAAGYDKNGEVTEELMDLTFGFVEVGTVTPKPQDGNPIPRLYRLPEDKAIINNMGMNNEGHDAVKKRLMMNIGRMQFKGILGVSLGANFDSQNPTNDYVQGIEKFSDIADYLVLNLSCPNTSHPGSMQEPKNLVKLLKTVKKAISDHPVVVKPVLMIKISPDLSDREILEISKIIQHPDTSIDGIVISNTTTRRDILKTRKYDDVRGGVSGLPLKNISNEMIKKMYILTKGKIPIVGSGGVMTANDVYEKIALGASLVQLYSGFVYHGPQIIKDVYTKIPSLLQKKRMKNIKEAIGSGVDMNTPIDQLLDL